MIKFRLFNGVFLLFTFCLLYFAILPWREAKLANNLNIDSSIDNIVKLPFSIEPARLFVQNNASSSFENLEKLEDIVKTNISNRPFYALSWLDLARVQDFSGTRVDAIKSASQAQELWPNIGYSLYLVGSFWFKLSEKEKAIKTFGQYLRTNPAEFPTVVTITMALERDTDELVNSLLVGDWTDKSTKNQVIENLFQYAIDNNLLNVASSIWQRFYNLLKTNDEIVGVYLDYLIKNDLTNQAVDVWYQYKNGIEIKNTILNSSFESDISNGSFGWRIRETKRANWMIDSEIAYEGNNSLRVEFTGNENINYYHIEQIVPVESGGRYQLSAYWRGKNITTDTTPYVELSAMNTSKPKISKSKSKAGHWAWERITSDILMPTDSDLLKVRIRRAKSNSFDKNIEGTLWFDDFKLEKIEE